MRSGGNSQHSMPLPCWRLAPVSGSAAVFSAVAVRSKSVAALPRTSSLWRMCKAVKQARSARAFCAAQSVHEVAAQGGNSGRNHGGGVAARKNLPGLRKASGPGANADLVNAEVSSTVAAGTHGVQMQVQVVCSATSGAVESNASAAQLPGSSTERLQSLQPNPSLKRTRTGMPFQALISF